MDAAHADAFVAVLERRMESMSASQAARLKRVVREVRRRKGTTEG
jgi:hypothetical protein